jgi:hypothetical protein
MLKVKVENVKKKINIKHSQLWIRFTIKGSKNILKIQKSIIKNVASRNFKRVKGQISHINHSYRFIPTTCTTIEDVNLGQDDFVEFYKLLYFIITIHEHVIAKFPNLLPFLDS